MKRVLSLFAALMMAMAVMMAQDAPKRYGIKSGEVKTVTEMMGQRIESPSWFDNYGALMASKANANGMEVSTIMRDGKCRLRNLSIT